MGCIGRGLFSVGATAGIAEVNCASERRRWCIVTFPRLELRRLGEMKGLS